ncbi:MAG: hypothetical protein M5T61_16930 [Acidimicrobiia bacterium]|nr:hypothetical protein [Acidimicrobiia bacterium]
MKRALASLEALSAVDEELERANFDQLRSVMRRELDDLESQLEVLSKALDDFPRRLPQLS